MLAAEENNVEAFVRSGGGIEDCDVIWDIFWKRQQDSTKGDFEYKDRFIMIKRAA